MNILPFEKKEEIKKAYKMRILVSFFWALSFSFIICGMLLLPIYIIASAKVNEINERKELNLKATQEQLETIGAPALINQKSLIAIKNIQSAYVSKRIIKIADTTLVGVMINKLSYEKQKISVSGIASNRDALTNFKRKIEKIDFVQSVSIPVGDFAKDKDLAFTMTVNIKNE